MSTTGPKPRPDKSRKCKFFARTQSCKLGSDCPFAHDSTTLAPTLMNDFSNPSSLSFTPPSPSAANNAVLVAKLLDAIRPKTEKEDKVDIGSQPPCARACSKPIPSKPMPVQCAEHDTLDAAEFASLKNSNPLSTVPPKLPASVLSPPLDAPIRQLKPSVVAPDPVPSATLSLMQPRGAGSDATIGVVIGRPETSATALSSIVNPCNSGVPVVAPPPGLVLIPLCAPPPGLSASWANQPSVGTVARVDSPTVGDRGVRTEKASLLLSLLKIDNSEQPKQQSSPLPGPPLNLLPGPQSTSSAPQANFEMPKHTEECSPPTTTAPIPKRVLRGVHNQSGLLRVSIRNTKNGHDVEVPFGYYLRPCFRMFVEWKLPRACLKSPQSLSIGLLRYGASTNLPAIVTKPLEVNSRDSSSEYISGTISFFAPKAAGKFVYRLFDSHSKETALETLATSVMFSVSLTDGDIHSNLSHVLDAFTEGAGAKAVSQLTSIVLGIKSCSNENVEAIGALNRCLERALDSINSSFAVLDESEKRKSAEKHSAPAEDLEDAEAKPDDGEFWQSYRSACRLQVDCYELFRTLASCKTPWYLVSEKLKNSIRFAEGLFCPLLKRFYSSHRELMAGRLSALGFVLSTPDMLRLSSAIVCGIDPALQQFALKLFPPAEFYAVREKAREQLEFALVRAGVLPPKTSLVLYGSSANNFGNAVSDMDMCLFYGSALELTASEKAVIIENIGTTLTKLGMTDVRTRITARIPIVQFHNAVTGLEGDVSLHNGLALANTRLLRTYADVDPRVRMLAYIIKCWAKARHINSPMEGTLSSYGFVLTVLHFLQTRPVPLLLSLQQLYPTWGSHAAPPGAPLPKIMERNAADGHSCNVYFLNPGPEQMVLLQRKAAENKESLMELLVGYFRYFAWEFDYKHHVVSIRDPSSTVWKIDKGESAAWPLSDNLSIEDPFETFYDVAHVIKAAQMTHIRKEFVRAFTIASRLAPDGRAHVSDSLPHVVHPFRFMDVLCEMSEQPSFSRPR